MSIVVTPLNVGNSISFAMPIPASPPSTKSAPSNQPFFIMDWLEDLTADQDLEKIAQLLRTPNKGPRDSASTPDHRDDTPTTPKSSNRSRKIKNTSCTTLHLPSMTPQALFPLFRKDSEPKQASQHKLSPPPTPPTLKSPQSIYKRTLSLGNGWNAKGLQKAQEGLWKDALACWDQALEIRGSVLGRNHLEVANTYNNKGIALGKLGLYDEALEALNAALEIRRASLGSSHAQVISTWHNLANVHQQAGDSPTALQIFRHARELGSEPLPLARICTAMGHVYDAAEQWVDARDAYQDAWKHYQKHYQAISKDTPSQLPNTEHRQEIVDLQHDLVELDQRMKQLELTLS